MTDRCPRCGKAAPADIHTCTPLQTLVDALYERLEEEMLINEELRRKLARLDGKTRRATRDEKIVRPGVYEVRE